ncbi:MAG TPA: YciI family protein [Polyangiaceae bacterium]|jgi:hypothetical protein|nr:YciI family protein [Polyangiaceae bacterium]
MAEFVMLFRGDQPQGSADQMQKRMQRWGEWMKELKAQGCFKGGQPLERGGQVVTRQKTITDGPFAEAKDLIGGFMLIEVRDLAAASEVAKGCPIFDSGGFVEVRPVMQMNM